MFSHSSTHSPPLCFLVFEYYLGLPFIFILSLSGFGTFSLKGFKDKK